MKFKEIKIDFDINDRELQNTIRSVHKLLLHGIKVKISMNFKKTEIYKSDRGKIKFNTIISSINSKVIVKPTIKGNTIFMWLAPYT